jgi:hypothetical protein
MKSLTAEICSNGMYKLNVFTISHLLYLTAITIPADFGQHKGMYQSKVNTIFYVTLPTVYMQLGAAVN